VISGEEFDALFDGFQSTAFRWESLPAYDVGGAEAERLAAWREGSPRPVQSVRTSPWLARIAATTTAGKRWARVRVVDEPPTDYQRFQLAHAYPEAQAVGDEVRLIRRADVDEDWSDFWLFDAGLSTACAVEMVYDEAGHWLSADLSRDPDHLAVLIEFAAEVTGLSIPLNAYLTGMVRA